MSNTQGTHATILVGIFPSDPRTENELNAFLTTIQSGLNKLIPTMASPLPDVHCLYFRQGYGSYQFELTTNGDPIPQNGSSPTYSGTDIPKHLEEFLKSNSVCDSIKSGNTLYMIIGAHGRPVGNGSVAVVIRRILDFFKTLFSFRSRPYWKSVFQAFRDLLRPVTVGGQAFRTGRGESDSITLTKLANSLTALRKTGKPLQTLFLHCCHLSSLEVAFELRIAEHHIACESQLDSFFNVSTWFGAMANNSEPRTLTDSIFDTIPCDVQGIFSSHWTGNRANPSAIPDYIAAVNRLGNVLGSLLTPETPETRARIETARYFSRTDQSDIVDICSFTQKLADAHICTTAQAIELEQVCCVIRKMQIRGLTVNVPDHDTHQGLGIYIPESLVKWDPADLPQAFQNAAVDWVCFLRKWLADR